MLAADSSRPALLGLFLAAILFAAWAAWFLLAQVGVYEVSENARLLSSTQIIADFPVSALGRIQVGQSARVRLAAYPWTQYGTLSATVVSTDSQPRDGMVRVRFRVVPDSTSAIRVQPGLTGEVEVEIERVSPAVLALRAAGQFVAPSETSNVGGPANP